jgi:hypothetical protein
LVVDRLALLATTPFGPLSAENLRLKVQKDRSPRVHHVELGGGYLRSAIPHVPELFLENARLRVQPGSVFLTRLNATGYSAADLDATGEWTTETGDFSMDGRISGVKSGELLSEDWSRRLTGDIDSGFTLQKRSGGLSANGRLTLSNGVLTALPMLDALAAYSDTRRFRTLVLSETHTAWRWQPGMIELSELVIASDRLIRLEGRVVIRGRELDGHLRLGIAPGSLGAIPGAETHVFFPGERGLSWAAIHLTGTLDDPREDLSERLLAAAGLRMLETLPDSGARVLKHSKALLGDDPSKAVEKGVRILEESTDVVRDVHGILDGILGSGNSKKPEQAPQNQQVE